MATGSIKLSIPMHSGDTTNPPKLLLEDDQWLIVFDDTVEKLCYWHLRCPENFASDFVMKMRYRMAGANTSDEIIMRGGIRAVADGQDPGTETFSETIGSAVTVPDTADQEDEYSLALTSDDSIAAGESMTFRLATEITASYTVTGDLKVSALTLEYTTT